MDDKRMSIERERGEEDSIEWLPPHVIEQPHWIQTQVELRFLLAPLVKLFEDDLCAAPLPQDSSEDILAQLVELFDDDLCAAPLYQRLTPPVIEKIHWMPTQVELRFILAQLDSSEDILAQLVIGNTRGRHEIYRKMAGIDNWESFLRTAAGISIKKQRRMISQSGLINEKIKLRMLNYWMNKHTENEEKGSLREELVTLAEEFMGRKAKSGAFRNRNFKTVSRIVSGAILDEDWLEFSRTKLKLSDKEIENIIGRHGEFSDEFKYQLIIKLQQEALRSALNPSRVVTAILPLPCPGCECPSA
ncbi:uncharacterized protein LOC120348511 isoform X2 [Styela clava]